MQKIFVKRSLGKSLLAQTRNCLARTGKTEPTTVFLSCAEMHIRSLAKFKCRYCDAPVEADAGVCHCCGVAYPTSLLRAVLLSPFVIAFYVVAVLAFMTFWFWQDF